MTRSQRTFCLVLALLVSGNAWCAPASSSPSGAAALVGRLYRTFAWESLSPADATTSKLFGVGLADQPLAELAKYFDAGSPRPSHQTLIALNGIRARSATRTSTSSLPARIPERPTSLSRKAATEKSRSRLPILPMARRSTSITLRSKPRLASG